MLFPVFRIWLQPTPFRQYSALRAASFSSISVFLLSVWQVENLPILASREVQVLKQVLFHNAKVLLRTINHAHR
jgi:hypothetical protein